jgi:hypothetical protein
MVTMKVFYAITVTVNEAIGMVVSIRERMSECVDVTLLHEHEQ